MGKTEKLSEKRIGLCRKMGLFGAIEEGVTVARAITAAELEAAYELVHDVFVEKDYIPPMPGGIRLRPFEGVPRMATFVARDRGRVVGVMSIVPHHPELGLPSDQAFCKEIGELRAAGRQVCEITNLAVKGQYRRSSAFTELTRACFAQALAWKCDDVFIAISPGHAMFFEGVLQFDSCGDQRSYSAEKMDIVEGKRLDLREVSERWADVDAVLGENALLVRYYLTDNPYHQRVGPWAEVAEIAFLQPQLLRRLFVERSGLLDRLGEEALAILRREWGAGLFRMVWGQAAEIRPVGERVAAMAC